MNIEELIHDLRARINPQYFDQIGTESYERNQCVMALEYLREENERQRFDILAMNHSLDLMREENERLRAENIVTRYDADRIDWLADVNNTIGGVVLPRHIVEQNISSLRQAIDAARGEK